MPTALPWSVPWTSGDSQVGRLGKGADQMWGQRGQNFAFMFPQFQGMVNDPGYSSEEQSAIMQDSLGAAEGTFGAYRDRATSHAARTRDSAGYGSLMSRLGRDEASAKAGLTRQNMISFADEKFRRKMAGLEGLAKLYGIDTSFLNSLMSQATGIHAGREARKSGIMDWLNFAKNTGKDILGGIFGGDED